MSGGSWRGDFALDDIRLGDCLTVGCSASPNLPCIESSGTCDPSTGRCSVYADGTPCDLETTNNFEVVDSKANNIIRKICVSAVIRVENLTYFVIFCTQIRCDDSDSLTLNDVCTSGMCMGAAPSLAPSLTETKAKLKIQNDHFTR